MSHSHLAFKNGLIIKPNVQGEEYFVSKCQFVFTVKPGECKGIFAKPFTGFERGAQASTPKLIDVDEFDSKITNYYKEHYDRYELSQYKIPNIEDDLSGDEAWPDDDINKADEGTAPQERKFRVIKKFKDNLANQVSDMKDGLNKNPAQPQEQNTF